MNVDPLTEKYNFQSPYVYADNNPVFFVDINGMSPMSPLTDIYLNRNGKEILRVKNNQPDRTFIVKTTKTTKQLYEGGIRDGHTNPISKDVAKKTENLIKSGNVNGEHMSNTVQISNPDTQQEMLEHVSQDNGKGGVITKTNFKNMNPNNFKEFSGNIDKNGKIIDKTYGPLTIPMAGVEVIEAGGNYDFHSHPSGLYKDGDITRGFTQPPSYRDISSAKGTEYVFGMRLHKVYIYNETGVVAIIPFKKFGNKK